MSLVGVIAALALLALGAAWIILPLFREGRWHDREQSLTDKQYHRLQVYYRQVKNTIRDLDEDFEVGKLAPEVYQQERELWTERGVQILKAVDEFDHRHGFVKPAAGHDAAITDAIDAAIEAAVAERLKASTAAVPKG
jgi:hypothetical protein